MIAFSAHVSASSGCACFCSISAARSPGHCGPLAEMLDSVTAKKVRSRRILFKSGSCDQHQDSRDWRCIRGSSPTKKGRWAASHDRLRATLREDGPDLARITNQGWRRGRWGSFGRCIAGTGFAHRGGMVTGTWILPRSLMMPESARRGREEQHRTYHAVCR